MELDPLLVLGSVVVESKQHILQQGLEELFSTKQYIKAYISAMASWVKASIIRLPSAAAKAATGESDDEQYDLAMINTSLGHPLLHVCPQQIASSSSIACNSAHLPADEQGPSLGPEPTGPYSSNLHLMEYVWLSRGVAALAQHALDLPASHDDCGRSSGVLGSSRGTGVQGNDCNSSSNMSGADSSSSSSRAADSSTRQEVVQTVKMLEVRPRQTCSLRARVVGVGMCSHQQLSGWHATTTTTNI